MTASPATATDGFNSDLDVTKDLVLTSPEATAAVQSAVSNATIARTITGAATLTLTLEDPARYLLNSKLFASKVSCAIAGINFQLVEVAKSGNQLTTTFEDAIVARMRNTAPPGAQAGTTKSAFASALGAMTRVQFMQRVLNIVFGKGGVTFYGWPDAAPLQEVLTWGTTEDPTEDAWTCFVRLANEVQWRGFSDGKALWAGPDTWLLQRPLAATLYEHTGGVGDIDFDWDIGKAQATATSTVATDVLSFPPGAPVQLSNLGVATGKWLTSNMSRNLYLPDATVNFVQAQPALAEPSISGQTPLVTNTDGTPINQSSDQGSAAAMDAVAFALAQQGKPYIWGGTGPTGYDCSGLVMAAYASAGITIPRTSQEQWSALTHVRLDQLLPGDLVFYAGSDGTTTSPGHVVMYIGNGQIVQAAHTGTVIAVSAIYGGAIGAARPAP